MSSRYFHIVNGKARDWKFKRNPNDPLKAWQFFLDNVLVAQVFDRQRMGWGCYNNFGTSEVVYGFKTRHHAIAFILQHCQADLEHIFK